MSLQEFKCPNCGGAVGFDSTLQKMKCPYCDAEFEMESIQALRNEAQYDQPDQISWETPGGTQWQEGEAESLRSYVCNSCGGEIVGDEQMAATSCPYCDNPVVMTGQFAGQLRPDLVIPFKLDKNAAKAGLQNHLKGKRFLPKVFKDENHIDEIKGMYVPFWLFDADANARIRYRATKVRRWMDSRYNYTETRYYSILRAGSLGFNGIPVDGSSKMPDDLMESIEPYDAAAATEFSSAYLAGYLADKYDVTAEQSVARANERVKRSIEQAIAATVTGYSTVRTESSSVNIENGKARYALYPVWLLNTTFRDKKYTFAMNGQTGKFIGDLPADMGAVWKWRMILTAACSVAVYLISYLVRAYG